MALQKDKSAIFREVGSFEPSNELFYEGSEWLETNGLGGWAGCSITGCNTRRYHALLVAATRPPTQRMVLLSKLEETIIINDARAELGVNLYNNDVIHPHGYRFLESFKKEIFPQWLYEAEGVQLRKTIAMVQGENTTVVLYEVMKTSGAFTLELSPLIAARGYHSLQHSYNNIFWDVQFDNGIFKNRPYDDAPAIFIAVPNSTYQHHPSWFYKFNYRLEKYRGLDFEEDLFNHGTISVGLKEGDRLGIIISTEDPSNRNAIALFEKDKQRKCSMLRTDRSAGSVGGQLTLAADQFIVKRGEDLKTVIAGYHWFTDWGRDTMISLPGLCLGTARYDDAKKIIGAFAENVSQGMLPNRFRDNSEAPEYNNVDGTLWYFVAIYKYWQHTKDTGFVMNEILPVLKDIIDWHFRGTRYNIHVDEDGLLYAGEKGQQLTWMDARIGDWVVTPRMGKAVEIQALWYNALNIFSKLLELNGQDADAARVCISVNKAKKSFLEKFWFQEGNYLYDVIDENGNPDASLRPNQLLAISLPFPLIEGDKAGSVLKVVGEKLYTPVGLRSLSQDDHCYIPVYGGDALKRDSCYHQGTVWSWLLGPYVDALMKVTGEKSAAQKVIRDFQYHLNEACLGSVSEIFDAKAPHYPRGCVAQAWGVAEILRVINEYGLGD